MRLYLGLGIAFVLWGCADGDGALGPRTPFEARVEARAESRAEARAEEARPRHVVALEDRTAMVPVKPYTAPLIEIYSGD